MGLVLTLRLRPTKVSLTLDDMMGTFNVSNKNLVAITTDLRQVSHKLNGSDALWQLLDDQQLATNRRQTLRQAASATAGLQSAARDVQQLTHGIRQGRGRPATCSPATISRARCATPPVS